MHKNHIVINEKICGGKPHISGHRVRVQDIALWHEKLGFSADEILIQVPSLTFSDVYAALSFYFDNKEQIDKDILDEQNYSENFQKNHPSKLKLKMDYA